MVLQFWWSLVVQFSRVYLSLTAGFLVFCATDRHVALSEGVHSVNFRVLGSPHGRLSLAQRPQLKLQTVSPVLGREWGKGFLG